MVKFVPHVLSFPFSLFTVTLVFQSRMRSSLISLLWIILAVASLLVATAAVSVSVSSVSGTDISSCGSAVSPCRTLAYGICGVLAPLMSCNASCAAAGTRTVGVVYLLAGIWWGWMDFPFKRGVECPLNPSFKQKYKY